MGNNSSFITQHSPFAVGALFGQKETPRPLNCKQLRKGSWSQLLEATLASGFSQTFCKQISLTRIGGECR